MVDEVGKKVEEQQSAINRVRKKLDINTVSYAVDNDTRNHSKQLIARAGEALTPEGCVYVGSAVVHVYERVGKHGEMSCVSYTGFSKAITEVQAGLAMDELRRKLMAAYGRSPVGR